MGHCVKMVSKHKDIITQPTTPFGDTFIITINTERLSPNRCNLSTIHKKPSSPSITCCFTITHSLNPNPETNHWKYTRNSNQDQEDLDETDVKLSEQNPDEDDQLQSERNFVGEKL